MASKVEYVPCSRIEKHTNMTLSDLLNCFSEMRRRDEVATEREKEKDQATLKCNSDFFSHLSLEIICHVLDYLPLRDVLRMEQQCKKIQKAVSMHLRVRKSIDFTEGEINSWIPVILNDAMLSKLISRCNELDSILGFHSQRILKRRQRGSEMLTIPGIIAALSLAPKLKGIEVSNISLMEAILTYLPRLEIIGTFRNRNGCFPINPSNKLVLTSNPKITSLHLTGVVISELPRMSHMKHLYLRWVKITHSHPFRDFSVPCLQSFVMSNCAGPSSTLKYVPLITGLAAARSLTRLELVRVPFLGGLIQHIVEDSWRVNGFSQLQSVTFGACKHAQEVDLGFLMITAAHSLESLGIQPLLTKDSLFAAIKMADVSFPVFESLHLGYVDPFPEPGRWNQDDLVMLHGLAEVSENPAMITDIGMKAIGQCFSYMRNLEIYNCPHLHFPTSWSTNGVDTWSHLRHLHLRRCHAIRLQDFCRFVESLPQLELLHLEYMFREPPKGCARVGLSAGTGLGVSSALVQNNGNEGANIDGVNPNDDDGDLNRDDNNNNNINPNGVVGVGIGGDVNNNEPDNNDIDNINADLYADPLDDEDDDFEEFSDNPDDLDFDGLSEDEENIDFANHIGDDIQIGEVAAKHNSGNNSQEEDILEDGPAVKSKPNQQVERNKYECKAGSSCEEEPQPSTSAGYSPGCCRKRDVGMAAMPTVDSRSTCQLIDIDIGNDSDTDMSTPPEGKIKVKVECNSAFDRPKDDTQGGETKFVSSSSGTHRIIEDSLPSTSGLSQGAPSYIHNSKTYKRNIQGVAIQTGTASGSIHGSSDDNIPTPGTSAQKDKEETSAKKKRKSSESDMILDSTSESGNNYSECQSVHKSKNCTQSSCDSVLPKSSVQPSSSQDFTNYSKSCNLSNGGIVSKEKCKSSSGNECDNQECNLPSSSSNGQGSSGGPQKRLQSREASGSSKNESLHAVLRTSRCCKHAGTERIQDSTNVDSEDDKDFHNTQSNSEAGISGSQKERTDLATDQLKGDTVTEDMDLSTPCSGRDNITLTEEAVGTGRSKESEEEKVEERKSYNMRLRNQGKRPNERNAGAGTSRKHKDQDEICEDIAQEHDLDLSRPCNSGNNSFLFSEEDLNSEEDRDEMCKNYNMRPRKRGKSLNGKKKGLVKKRRTSLETVKSNSRMHDKSCQAVSDEIRETTKRAKEQEEAKAGSAQPPEGDNSRSVGKRCTRSQSSVGDENRVKSETFTYRSLTRRKKNMIDKSTSTSDPVIEDDHIQVLSLRSKSLMCVTLYMVGVTDIIIDECPNLTLLRGSACRVLKKVTVGGAPKLSKVSFAQCKKIDEMHLVNEVCDQISQANRVVYLRPMRQFDMFAFENMLFSQPDTDYHLCVIYDYSPDPSSTMYNRARVTSWLDLFSGMNMELLRFMDFEQAKNFPVDEENEEKCYRNAYVMHGYNDDGSEWMLSTDIPWLEHLSQCANIDTSDLHPDDYKEGLYCPRRKGHHLTTDCLMDLQDVISDMRNKDVSLYCYSVIVYINMCDVSGTPTPDIYL